MSRSTDRLASPTLSSPRSWRLGVLGDSSSLRRFMRNRAALVGLAIVVGFALVGLFAPALAPHEALTMSLGDSFLPPGPEHPLGTDDLGRDVLSRLRHAARYDLGLALVTVLLAGLAGVGAGGLAAT